MRYNGDNGYMDQWLRPMHETLYRQNIECDIIVPDDDLSKYDLVLIPPLYIASDSLLNKISDHVKKGGHVVMTMKSGFCDENSTVRPTLAPGPLRAACGFYYQEFSSIAPTALKDDPYKAGSDNKVRAWAEFIIPETAKPLAYYDDNHWGKHPAILTNKFGKGTLTYIGTVVSNSILKTLLLEEVKQDGLNPSVNLVYPIILRPGVNDFRKKVHYIFNYADEVKNVIYPFGNGVDLLKNTAIKKGDPLNIQPWGAIIVEEK